MPRGGREPLLVEIGCEEIPARMIARATEDLVERVVAILSGAAVGHGAARGWGGSRRLAVYVGAVEAREPDRDETRIGPPARAAYDADGKLTRAARGFARKQGVAEDQLERLETERGSYVGIRRRVAGREIGCLLAETLPAAVEGLSFPKTMRWGEGTARWVRPVHWVLALHGSRVLPLRLFGIDAGATSRGHRFLSAGPVRVRHPDDYATSLEAACVLVDPERRRQVLAGELQRRADELGGRLVSDDELLAEVGDLVEWPGVVAGRFDEHFLQLPQELLVTTLRHHQKCFSVQDPEHRLLACFLAVANTDRDPAGHVRRGNEWVVGGRLDDARFFWHEDRKRPLAEREASLQGVVFHGRLGSYSEKAQRMERLAGALAQSLGLASETVGHCRQAARLAKNDLVTGTVGEFPELQGVVGGLLLLAEGHPEPMACAVYEHYRPAGPDDPIPSVDAGCVVALADKLDSVAQLVAIGEAPTGSRDPFGLRRSSNGVFRILIERRWPLSVADLVQLSEVDDSVAEFLADRLQGYLRDRGATANEIRAVFRAGAQAAMHWPLPRIVSRLEALAGVRERDDFAHLVELTKRVDNILSKGGEQFAAALSQVGQDADFSESKAAALKLWQLVERYDAEIAQHEQQERFEAVLDLLAELVTPVDRFFADVLVLDPDNPRATLHRKELLRRLRALLTRCFDIRELAGEADRRS